MQNVCLDMGPWAYYIYIYKAKFVSHYVSIPSGHIACRYSTVGIIYIYFTS